jgi:hypothetical protein
MRIGFEPSEQEAEKLVIKEWHSLVFILVV